MEKFLTINHNIDTQYVLIKTDYPYPRMCDPSWNWGGAKEANVYPATVPGFDVNLNSKIPRKRWPKSLAIFYRDLNRHNLEYAFRVTNGNINNGDPNQQIYNPESLELMSESCMPKFETITYVGNIHVVKEIRDNKVLLDTITFDDPIFNAYKMNYKTSTYISKFTAIRNDGYLFNMFSPPDDNYLPLVSYTDFWIPMERAELFPKLNFVKVIASDGVNVRSLPDISSEKLDKIIYGKTVFIEKYYPSMGNIWGLTDYGWIALRYLPYSGSQCFYETTTFHLVSPAPLKPMREIYSYEIAPTYYESLTNQKMINIFYLAAADLNINGWFLIEKAGLTNLVIPDGNRSLVYTGPRVEKIDTLNGAEIEALLLYI